MRTVVIKASNRVGRPSLEKTDETDACVHNWISKSVMSKCQESRSEAEHQMVIT